MIRSFHAGDEEVFRELVTTHSPRLLPLIRSFARDEDEAMDLLQETWTRAFAKRTSYDGRGSLFGWLLSVARSVCLSAQRKHRPTVLVGHHDGHDAETPLTELERRDSADRVRLALMSLTERQRAAVVLRMLEGMSTKQAAEHMGCAEGTVKATLHQALRLLKGALGDASHEAP